MLQTFKNYVALTSCFITDPHHQDSIIIHGNRVFWFDPHFVILHGGLYVTLQTLWSPEKHTGNMLLKVSNTCDSIGFIYLLYDREGNNHSYDNVLPNIYQTSLGFLLGRSREYDLTSLKYVCLRIFTWAASTPLFAWCIHQWKTSPSSSVCSLRFTSSVKRTDSVSTYQYTRNLSIRHSCVQVICIYTYW